MSSLSHTQMKLPSTPRLPAPATEFDWSAGGASPSAGGLVERWGRQLLTRYNYGVDPRAEAIESARLWLEPLWEDHASEMVSVLADPELYRFTGSGGRARVSG